MKTNKKLIRIVLIFIFIGINYGCNDFLDVVPDNIPTVDHAFNKRYQAEGFLYGCYGFLPLYSNISNNPSFMAGDEAWLFEDYNGSEKDMWQIAKGEQSADSPMFDCWTSKQNSYSVNRGREFFTAIRDCNIFLENIHKPVDLEEWEQKQWIAEVKVLKAYFHFWLFKMYGPIPIIRENSPISSDNLQFHREPVDSVVSYIAELIDEALMDLPFEVENVTTEMGRITQPIALAIKAKVLVLAASPLFNGNPDYATFVDNREVVLFPQTYEVKKWEIAANALKDAIDITHEAGYELYDFNTSGITSNLNPQTVAAMQVRGAFTERWNSEIIWGDSRTTTSQLERFAFPAFTDAQQGGKLKLSWAPTLRVVEQFYTENGVPIEEDKDWSDIDLYGLRKGDSSHEFLIQNGFETINLHFNRESRFYGSISFDGGKFYGNGDLRDTKMKTTKFKFGANGRFLLAKHSSTGYLVKKVIHRLTAVGDTDYEPTYYRYSFPIIRLADLYLMYAEALNESKTSPDSEVYEYIDLVRKRTGLEGVIESWSKYSNIPNKPTIQEGMREIIQRERMNELAFEGHRFWDLRRWKLAKKYMTQPIRGLSILESEADEFYKVQEIYYPIFEDKDYFWPIRIENLLNNRNLIQNLGW